MAGLRAFSCASSDELAFLLSNMTDLSFFNLNVVGASFLKLMSVLEGNPA
jgi:hypothetical protein